MQAGRSSYAGTVKNRVTSQAAGPSVSGRAQEDTHPAHWMVAGQNGFYPEWWGGSSVAPGSPGYGSTGTEDSSGRRDGAALALGRRSSWGGSGAVRS